MVSRHTSFPSSLLLLLFVLCSYNNTTNVRKFTGSNKFDWSEADIIWWYGLKPWINPCNSLAILRILIRFNVLPSFKQRLPSLFLPFTSPKPPPPPHRLRRNHSHDHHLLLPANLLHIPVRPPLAFHLLRRNHSNGNVHNHYTPISNAFNGKIQRFPSFTLLFNGILRLRPCRSRPRRELEQPTTGYHVSLWGSNGGVLFDRDNVLCEQNSWKVEARMVWFSRTQSSNISCACCLRGFGSLRCYACVFGVARPCWLLKRCVILINEFFIVFFFFWVNLITISSNCYIYIYIYVYRLGILIILLLVEFLICILLGQCDNNSTFYYMIYSNKVYGISNEIILLFVAFAYLFSLNYFLFVCCLKVLLCLG